jgi:hypothetical protein
MKTIAKLVVSTAAALLVGCAPGRPDPVDLLPTAHDAAVLAAHPLGGSSLREMRLLATPDGRDALALAVSCALPAGVAITAITSNGIPYSFAGSLGLAPAWAQRTPTAGERRRVIDCMRARVTHAIRT